MAQVRWGIARLAGLGEVRASGLYRTEPLGDPGQPWYVNAVAELRTGIPPLELLQALQELERTAGRPSVRARWAPRRLDLDLLLYGHHSVVEPGLRIPHPRMHERRFVLEPLAELAAGILHPVLGRPISDLLAGLDDRLRVEKLPGLAAGTPESASGHDTHDPREASEP